MVLQRGVRREGLLRRGPAAPDQVGDRADPIDGGVEHAVRNGIHHQPDRLAQSQLAAVHFFQGDVDEELRKVGNLRDLRPGPYVVPFLEGRRGLAERALRAEIGKQRYQAIAGRAQLHHGQVILGELQIADGLILALAQPVQVGFVPRLVRAHGGLHLLQAAFGNPHLDAVLFAVDLGEHFGLAGIQLGALQAVLGGHFVHGVGFVVHHLGGLELLDVAIGGAHVGGEGDDVFLRLYGVELHYLFTLAHEAAVIGQVHNAQPGNLRRLENGGADALDVAAGAHGNDEIGLARARHRHLHVGGAGVAPGAVQAAAADGQRQRPYGDLEAVRMGAA